MKLGTLCLAVCVLVFSNLVQAQPELKQAGSTGTKTKLKRGEHSLKLKADETVREFEFEVENTESQNWKILGVQTTAGLYIADFPKQISAGKSATLSFLYSATPGQGGSGELIKVMTDRGEKVFPIEHGREPVVSFSTDKLSWSQGEAPSPQSVTITVADGKAVPRAARPGIKGTKALIEFISAGKYRVTVTPASTAVPATFPLFIEFDPGLVGGASIITCTIAPKA